MLGRLARNRTSVLDTLSCKNMPRIRWMLLRWKELSLFSCLAYVVHVTLPYIICGPRLAAVHHMWSTSRYRTSYVVHVSLPHISVLTTQALFTTILVFTVSLGLVHNHEVRRAGIVSAFPVLLLISVSKERLSVMVEPRYVNCSPTSSS